MENDPRRFWRLGADYRPVVKKVECRGRGLVGPDRHRGLIRDRRKWAEYYLQFVAMISVYLAVFKRLADSALDGGRLIFWALEAVRANVSEN